MQMTNRCKTIVKQSSFSIVLKHDVSQIRVNCHLSEIDFVPNEQKAQ